MITEKKTTTLEISENKTIFVVDKIDIIRDVAIIATTKHRTTLEPGSNLEGQSPDVINLAGFLWTEEVIQNYLNSINTKE